METDDRGGEGRGWSGEGRPQRTSAQVKHVSTEQDTGGGWGTGEEGRGKSGCITAESVGMKNE